MINKRECCQYRRNTASAVLSITGLKTCFYNSLLIILSLLFFAPLAHAADAVGKFSAVEGRVEVMRYGRFPAVMAGVGTPVFTNDIIKTKSNGKAEIIFKDETIVRLGHESELKIDEYVFNPDGSRNKGVLNLFRGRIRAVVSKTKGVIPAAFGKSSFNVNTSTSVAGVRGTDFFKSFFKGTSEVIVKEGEVEVYNPKFSDAVIIVTAGNMTIVKEDMKPTLPEPLPPEKIKEYEKETAPAASSSPQLVPQKELMRFIGCEK